MTQGHLRPSRAAAEHEERPALPTGARRTTRLAALPLRHAARTASAATRLSRAAADEVAARAAEQLPGTPGELKGGAAKPGQAMPALDAAAPYRAALRRLTDAVPPMPAEAARRVIMADPGAAFGPGGGSGRWNSTTCRSPPPRSARCTARGPAHARTTPQDSPAASATPVTQTRYRTVISDSQADDRRHQKPGARTWAPG
jgi:hypothetical protein